MRTEAAQSLGRPVDVDADPSSPLSARPSDELGVTVIAIGDELLDGFVPESNASWLGKMLHEEGISLTSVRIVRDALLDIEKAVVDALAEPRPRLVITSGGIGPTFDDVTHEAVARAVGVPLYTEPTLERLVEIANERTRQHGFGTDEAKAGMMRIARIPQGSEVLHHRTWLAATLLQVDGGSASPRGASVVSMPGPPGHFQALMRAHVFPRLLRGRGRSLSTVEVAHRFPESVLAECFTRLRQQWSNVRVGSYPGERPVVRLTGPPGTTREAADFLEECLQELRCHPAAEDLQRSWERGQVAAWGQNRHGAVHHDPLPGR